MPSGLSLAWNFCALVGLASIICTTLLIVGIFLESCFGLLSDWWERREERLQRRCKRLDGPYGFKSVILFIAFLSVSSQANALTLADLRSEARTLSLDNGTRLRFSTATVDSFLNEAQRLSTIDTKAVIKGSSFELSVGTTFYSLPSDYLQMRRLTLRYLSLSEATQEMLDNKAGLSWETASSLPTNYFISFSSRTRLGFYPWPSSVSSTGTVRYEYYAQASEMSLTTDVPWSGIVELYPYHEILAYYAAYRMAAIDGRADLASLYRTEYYEGLDRMKREALARPSYHPSAVPGVSTNRIGP